MKSSEYASVSSPKSAKTGQHVDTLSNYYARGTPQTHATFGPERPGCVAHRQVPRTITAQWLHKRSRIKQGWNCGIKTDRQSVAPQAFAQHCFAVIVQQIFQGATACLRNTRSRTACPSALPRFSKRVTGRQSGLSLKHPGPTQFTQPGASVMTDIM